MTGTAFIYAPRSPHPDSLADSKLMIRDASGEFLVHYCPLHQVGGVYDLRNQAWTLYTPMTAQEFIGALEKLDVTIADTGSLQTWIDAITQQQPIRGKH